MALSGASCRTLKDATDDLILYNLRRQELEEKYKFKILPLNHIDLIEVAPLKASLKVYGGRLHCERMQDLPYDPSTALTASQMNETRFYCLNDLDLTALLCKELCPQLELRAQMSVEYGQDLRSKSDAQIAECVISEEVAKVNGRYSKRPRIAPGTIYKYKVPKYIKYQSEQLNNMLSIVANADFVVKENGSIEEPEEFTELKKVKISSTYYRMGIGGLHSNEENVHHIADENTLLIDRDVASYYPNIILNQGLYPSHMGKAFLKVYRSIVERRLKAKKEKNKVVADSLKITINGSFGKLGSKYSSLYAPDLMIQVTISGQLSLLMLIEMIELIGIPVVSGNTDGIIIKCQVDRYNDLNNVVKHWERLTDFETEETRYKAVYSRDVNNYIAVKEDGKCKAKGAYSAPGLQKNPTSLICVDAIEALIVGSIPIEETILNCKDLTRFLTVRTVKGGGEQDGVYLGKAVRWYYSTETKNKTINYIASGNKVAKSEGAKPCMDLPLAFPNDINYQWYINETIEMLHDIDFYHRAKKPEQITFF